MAYALLTVYQVDRDAPTAGVDTNINGPGVGVGNGRRFPNDGHLTFLEVENGATGMTMSFVTHGTIDGEAIADKDIVIAINDVTFIGPFPASIYNNADGEVESYVDDETNGTVTAWRLNG